MGPQSTWSRKKKDRAPRGVFRHPSGVWAIRYACGAGCEKHEERIGPLKSDAIRAYHDRRARAHAEPGWCPAVERREARERARAEHAKQDSRMTFDTYAGDYSQWARAEHRGWNREGSRVSRLVAVFGARYLDEITTADIERYLDDLRRGEAAVSPASRNRYRDQLSGMFKRALRLALVSVNPVKGIPKLKESSGRVVFLGREEEDAVRAALPETLRPLFTVSINTGLRWSEQGGLEWRDVDLLSGFVTVRLSKNGSTRRVPLNSIARVALVDVASRRKRPSDPSEPVFTVVYRATARVFEVAVEAARATLAASGKDTSRLEGYTWHGNRHTFASRLVMTGVDLRTVQELGGWKTLNMVQRYAHLAPERLVAAVERMVVGGMEPPSVERKGLVLSQFELRQNFGAASSAACDPCPVVS